MIGRAGRWLGNLFRSLAEVAAAFILRLALRLLSALPYRLRRTGLVSVFALLRPVLTGRGATAMSRGFADVMASSLRDGRAFAYRKLRHDMIFLIEWMALGRRSVRGLVSDVRHVSSDAADDLEWLAAQRGVIVGTMHFGPYALGLVWLIHRYFQRRKVFIFKNENSEDEARAIARLTALDADIEFIAADAFGEFPRVVKAVRGGAVAIIMVDLPPDTGRCDAMGLFGHRLTVSTGVVDLAALARVPLALLRVRTTARGARVELDEIFDVARHDRASCDRAVTRITAFVGDTIHRYPEQWHLWSRFEEYLPIRGEAIV